MEKQNIKGVFKPIQFTLVDALKCVGSSKSQISGL